MKKLTIILGGLYMLLVPAMAQEFQRHVIHSTQFPKDTFDIRQHGALPDGITSNTLAINNAIDACSSKGGGVVLIPTGIWLTGPLVLKSNVNLYLAANALLLFTADLNEFKLIETNWEGFPAARNQSPISARGAENIAITGTGIIDGNGDAWRMVKKDKLTTSQWQSKLSSGGFVDGNTWYPTASSLRGSKTQKPGVLLDGKTLHDYDSIKDFLRPNLIVLTKCDRILLQGVTFQNSAAWCLHPLMSTNIRIDNIQVKNPWYAQNGDGLDLESCSNVLVENSVFDVGDDGICIKSGRDKEGRDRDMPTKNVHIKNCTVYHAHGGFVIGSEMSGGAKNILVEDCTFVGTDIGLRFKTTRGRGGIVENIIVNGITMKDIVGEAILFDMYYAAKDPILLAGEKRMAPVVEFRKINETTPQFRKFYISNVACNGAEKAIFIRGLPEMNIHDINLENIIIKSRKGVDISEAYAVSMKNIKLLTEDKSVAVIEITNSHDIVFESFNTNASPVSLLRISGERSAGIQWNKSQELNAGKVVFEFGANPKILKINK